MSTPLPLSYADLVFYEDLNLFALETTSDLQNLVQDIHHLLEEYPNSNPSDPDRGIGVELYLSGTVTQLNLLPNLINTQVILDDRVTSCNTTITQLPDSSFQIIIQIAVSTIVLPLEFNFSTGAGLINLTSV